MFAVGRFSRFSTVRPSIKFFKSVPLEPISRLVVLPNELFVNESKLSNFHTSASRHDMENAVRAVGCGIAAVGCGAAAAGLGIVFGNLTNAVARNPSLKNQLFQFAIIGGALCEALGLFAFIMGMMAMFA